MPPKSFAGNIARSNTGATGSRSLNFTSGDDSTGNNPDVRSLLNDPKTSIPTVDPAEKQPAKEVQKKEVKTSLTPEREAKILDIHNCHRARFGLAPLQWSESLAQEALQAASKCVWAHGSAEERKGHGENLALQAGHDVDISGWVHEETKWKCGTPLVSADLESTGHWTQMISSVNKQIGCAAYKCPMGEFLSCRYAPGGNFSGLPPFPTEKCNSTNQTEPCPFQMTPLNTIKIAATESQNPPSGTAKKMPTEDANLLQRASSASGSASAMPTTTTSTTTSTNTTSTSSNTPNTTVSITTSTVGKPVTTLEKPSTKAITTQPVSDDSGPSSAFEGEARNLLTTDSSKASNNEIVEPVKDENGRNTALVQVTKVTDTKNTKSTLQKPTANLPANAPKVSAQSFDDGLTPAEREEILNFHNKARSELGVPLLVWDTRLAEAATQYAKECTTPFQHWSHTNIPRPCFPYNKEQLEKDPEGTVLVSTENVVGPDVHATDRCMLLGENLYTGSNCPAVRTALTRWYEEIACTVCGVPIGEERGCVPQQKGSGACEGMPCEMCGHYTQMVASDSRKVGCALNKCSGNDYLVCEYFPGGNVQGERPFPCNLCKNPEMAKKFYAVAPECQGTKEEQSAMQKIYDATNGSGPAVNSSANVNKIITEEALKPANGKPIVNETNENASSSMAWWKWALIIGAVVILLVCVLAGGGFWGYKKYYKPSSTSMTNPAVQ